MDFWISQLKLILSSTSVPESVAEEVKGASDTTSSYRKLPRYFNNATLQCSVIQ